MDIKNQAREELARDRQHDDQLHDKMVSRAKAEKTVSAQSASVAEQARETLVEHRQHERHIQESMLERAEEEVET